MPHRKSALKRLRQDKKRTLRTKSVKSRLRTEQSKFDRMLERGDLEAAETQLNLLTKLYQKAGAKNIIHENNAARKVARAQRRFNELRAHAS